MTQKSANGLSRRGVLAGFGAGAASVTLASMGGAQAASLPAPESFESYDVVVIGSGMAGCAAALEAVSRGARVVVLEKSAAMWMGGNSLLAGGSFAIPLEDTAEAKTAFVEDYEKYCLGRGNTSIFRLMAEHCQADLDWLAENGIEFLAAEPRPPNRVATVGAAPGSFVGMPRVFRLLRARIEALGGVFAFDTKARQLILNAAGAVSGVRALSKGKVVDYHAKSVVIAAGGYGGNSQMLEAYSDPNAGGLMVRGIKWATGDGLVMAQAAGAGIKGMGGMMALHIAAVDSRETAAGQPARAVPYSLSINSDGKRFIDESRGYVAHGKAVMSQPGQSTSLVFDENIRTMVADGIIGTFERLGLKVQKADTLQELAVAIGVPVETFMQTVQSYNAAVNGQSALGVDPPKQYLAYKIETAPFYAFTPLVPGITLTFGGIMIDDRARALEADGRVIAGLYAAGEGAGAVFFHDYIGGGSLSNCLVMGRIAGASAAA